MFKHILIPTDGSAVANKAVKAGIQLAKNLGAKVTGYYAIETLPTEIYGEGYLISNSKMVKSLQQRARDIGKKHLENIAKVAAAAGVPFGEVMTLAETPYDGIVEAAKKQKCDAIFMASHGRSGLADLVLGSVTRKVLTHSKLPVLVYR
ncbi:MAG: universal stress protein [Betaproteobacteria bacterium]|nr:universal stress protein [Betaproteobacteria bacterium]